MTKVRVSTTVDADLLARARQAHGPTTDASLLEAALVALLDARRGAEVDAAYERAYSSIPVTAPDAWGDLASWRHHAGST
jgi:hypothetical protein